MHIGLFFGSFNPVHIGHLALANYMLSFTDMEQVWFVVSPQNPLKNKAGLLNQNDRLHLVNLALEDHPKIKGSNIEFELSQPSYTVHTLAHLKEKYPGNTFSIIMGQDNLVSLHKWKNFETILDKHHIYVYPRTGASNSEFDSHPHVHFTQAPIIEVSATFIRKAIKDKKDIQYFLHPKVWQYVDEMHFYKK